jgi:hypothetical protein
MCALISPRVKASSLRTRSVRLDRPAPVDVNYGTCSCCTRTWAQQDFDRVQVEFNIRSTTVTCPQCKTPVPTPLALKGFLDRFDAQRRAMPDNFKRPLHLVLYQGSGSYFRGGKPRRVL